VVLAASGAACSWGSGSVAESSGARATLGVGGLNPPDTYVQLFKWRWKDIATECAEFLGPKGYGAVQISPPAAHAMINAWWNIYQPVNYRALVSDMGNVSDLAAMISACHAAGVRVYADAVFNQMAGNTGTASDGSSFNGGTGTGGQWSVPPQFPFFGVNDFHAPCDIQQADYNGNRNGVTNCRLLGLPDLATGLTYPRAQIALYLTSLMSMGVDGFRIDAAKHMLASDLQAILAMVPATTGLGEARFITQEVIPDGEVTRSDYFMNGTLNEFQFTYAVRDTFRNDNGLDIAQLPQIMGTGNGGGTWGFIPSAEATIFVDNHDTERSHTDSLNLYDDGNKRFDLANIFMLTQPYGRAQVQSGFTFSFSNTDQNAPQASPYDASGNAVIMGAWDFVHRWADLYPLVAFRSAAAGQGMTDFQTGNGNQIAYGRGSVGFAALNNDASTWNATLRTQLAPGTYCNVVHGLLNGDGSGCTGDAVTVGDDGQITVSIAGTGQATVPAVVIYTGQKVGSVMPPDGGTGGGDGGGGGTCDGSSYCPTRTPIDYDPAQMVAGQSVVLYYEGALAGSPSVNIHYGFNGWSSSTITDAAMTLRADGYWQSPAIALPATLRELDLVFNDGAGHWDNNGGQDWRIAVTTAGGCATSDVAVTFGIANAATIWGQNLYVVGNVDALGQWNPSSGFALAIQGQGANVPWTGTVHLPPSTPVQYKYVKYDPSNGWTVWEGNQRTASGNREITTPACGSVTFIDGSFLP
jgi:alpha-amylase